ncbi:uncharacterized protein LOC122084761 [Macadamia integrifolia]|uniref:uncharacterized protein LOC122084761 n=1 Tax=Macadamia integrifolia TaxID=60698 RepID=UPI001C4EF0F0|nr:uncharacterized protein LOC122084761 [Macadamia integrifolia]
MTLVQMFMVFIKFGKLNHQAISLVEAGLNWHAENATVQNQYLERILAQTQQTHAFALIGQKEHLRYLEAQLHQMQQQQPRAPSFASSHRQQQPLPVTIPSFIPQDPFAIQLQIVPLTESQFVTTPYQEFLGPISNDLLKARDEFLQMKCCSLLRPDLDKHFSRITDRFHKIGGIDDENLKQVFLNSMPEPLGADTQQFLKNQNIPLAFCTIGSLYSYALTALDKLCNIKKVWKDLQDRSDKAKTLSSDLIFFDISLSDGHLKNPDFFITLPFKKNEDVNPTKASHPGLNPEHLSLAIQETQQLQSQGLLEPTFSPWACQAFYVNKRTEQIREKLRMVINYRPLNHFLADEKFPLPTRLALLLLLAHATVFSKFNLKAGFWQLGIVPEDRPKTTFCIPGHHMQWTVMPFGLKTAPFIFQRAMIKIFAPIQDHALIYIDDILLFSNTEAAHLQLLQHFHQLVQQYGLMLSPKKIQIGVPSIDFLGVTISKGQYHLQPHIATSLQLFPDGPLTKKQVQQFLGIVNYMTEFLPQQIIHTSLLHQLLRKNAPPWSAAHTTAIQALKKLSEHLPTLQIPSTGKRILQTDASDTGAQFFLKNNLLQLQELSTDTKVDLSNPLKLIIILHLKRF